VLAEIVVSVVVVTRGRDLGILVVGMALGDLHHFSVKRVQRVNEWFKNK
jgi:hypothetical protein